MYWQRKYSTWPISTPPSSCVHSLFIGKEEDKTPIHMCVCMCARACDYITEKYKRKTYYLQKNNT